MRKQKHGKIHLALGILLMAACAFAAQAQERGISGTASAPAEKWAVIIGVGEYDDDSISDLPNAVNDAKALRDTLTAMQDGFPEENVKLLAGAGGDAPTRANIMRYLTSYLSLAQANDTLLVYFAGHGVTDNGQLYLLPKDAAAASVDFTGFPFAEIEDRMQSAAAKKKVLILDACHSGAGRAADTMSEAAIAQLERAAKGMVTLASCSATEKSHEMPDTGHGAFTWYLLDALRGKADRDDDGLVSASEVSLYTWDQTRRWAASQGFTQTPWRREEGSGEIMLAKTLVIKGEERPQRVRIHAGGGAETSHSATTSPGDTRTVDLGGGVSMELVWIPAGEFMMGSPESEANRGSDEGPVHRVEITKGFWMGKYEVTQEQWEAVMGNNPSRFKGPRNPIEQVSWNDCQDFLKKLNSRTSGGDFRLPTEAEWEYACRAGSTTAYSFGDDSSVLCRYGNYCDASNTSGHSWQDKKHNDGHDKTAPVGSFKPNGWGLYDMHGNVYEWCLDWYDADNYSRSPVRDPNNTSTDVDRVLRGGSWNGGGRLCRSAYRIWNFPDYSRSDVVGFRVVSPAL